MLSLLDILFPDATLKLVKQLSLLCSTCFELQPIYDGKVLVNQSAMDNPGVQSALKEMSKRNFEPTITIMGYLVHLRQALIMTLSETTSFNDQEHAQELFEELPDRRRA